MRLASGIPTRRFVICGGLALLGSSLAGCQGAVPAGESAVASSNGLAHLTALRAEQGLPPLKPDRVLEQAALRQSGYMATSGRMAHTTGWRRDFATRMKSEGVSGVAAENLARGRFDIAEVFVRWKNSPGHRRNMLDPRMTRFGLAYARGGKGSAERYWTLVVGG